MTTTGRSGGARLARRSGMLAVAGFLLGDVACPTPGQLGGLAEVDVAGFAGRMRALCRSGLAGRSGDEACPELRDAAADGGGLPGESEMADAAIGDGAVAEPAQGDP